MRREEGKREEWVREVEERGEAKRLRDEEWMWGGSEDVKEGGERGAEA